MVPAIRSLLDASAFTLLMAGQSKVCAAPDQVYRRIAAGGSGFQGTGFSIIVSEIPEARSGGRIAGLVKAHGEGLLRFFRRHARNEADAPDMVQDVFLKLTRGSLPDDIDHSGKYVIAVARSVLVDHHRRGMVRHSARHGELSFDLPDTDIAIERVLDGKAMAERMQAALLDLPERTRDVFALRTLQGLKMAEVASAMRISLSTAEKHHARALAYLAAQLADFRA